MNAFHYLKYRIENIITFSSSTKLLLAPQPIFNILCHTQDVPPTVQHSIEIHELQKMLKYL